MLHFWPPEEWESFHIEPYIICITHRIWANDVGQPLCQKASCWTNESTRYTTATLDSFENIKNNLLIIHY
jgi:hypothetical protein